MTKEKVNHPQNQEEIIKAAQEAALQATLEQAQSMFAGIPGFELPDMNDIQAQVMAQMKAAVPNLDEIQAQQAAMGTLGDTDAATMAGAARLNMAYAGQMMQELGGIAVSETTGMFDSDWEISRAGISRLNAEQLRLLAFGAPLLVYNDEHVDSIESEIDTDMIRTQLESWWNVTDRDSTLEIVDWLLNEGHHAEADKALRILHEKGLKNGPAEAAGKLGDVCLIVRSMLENGYCSEENIPQTAIAWDTVRVVNVGRWAYLCGYLTAEEMWEIMHRGADTAKHYFGSWEEYGRSFVLGRGVWHGDPDDSETAHEIVTVLLEKGESPWKQIAWEK